MCLPTLPPPPQGTWVPCLSLFTPANCVPSGAQIGRCYVDFADGACRDLLGEGVAEVDCCLNPHFGYRTQPDAPCQACGLVTPPLPGTLTTRALRGSFVGTPQRTPSPLRPPKATLRPQETSGPGPP